MLSTEEFRKVLPKQMQKTVNQGLIDSINATLTDPNMMDTLRENILGYTQVMREGTFKLTDYINAVKYVSYKTMGNTNIHAYIKTFPDRYAKFKAAGTADKDIASYVTSYNKNRLVNLIYEQTLIPTHILNAHVFQEAINTQAAIMRDPDISPKVRSDAANSIMTHLKQPEVRKIELDVGIKDSSALQELKEITMQLAAQQHSLIASGVYSAKEIAHQGILIEGSVADDQ